MIGDRSAIVAEARRGLQAGTDKLAAESLKQAHDLQAGAGEDTTPADLALNAIQTLDRIAANPQGLDLSSFEVGVPASRLQLLQNGLRAVEHAPADSCSALAGVAVRMLGDFSASVRDQDHNTCVFRSPVKSKTHPLAYYVGQNMLNTLASKLGGGNPALAQHVAAWRVMCHQAGSVEIDDALRALQCLDGQGAAAFAFEVLNTASLSEPREPWKAESASQLQAAGARLRSSAIRVLPTVAAGDKTVAALLQLHSATAELLPNTGAEVQRLDRVTLLAVFAWCSPAAHVELGQAVRLFGEHGTEGKMNSFNCWLDYRDKNRLLQRPEEIVAVAAKTADERLQTLDVGNPWRSLVDKMEGAAGHPMPGLRVLALQAREHGRPADSASLFEVGERGIALYPATQQETLHRELVEVVERAASERQKQACARGTTHEDDAIVVGGIRIRKRQ